jgi:hypothetical protein
MKSDILLWTRYVDAISPLQKKLMLQLEGESMAL